MRDFIRNNRGLIIAVLGALCVRLVLFIAVRPWDPDVVRGTILVMDAAGYQKLALGVLRSSSFEGFGPFRTPAYPLFLAAVYWAVGVRVWAAILLQILLSAGTGVLVYLWVKRPLGKAAAVAGAAVFAIQPHTAFYSLSLLTDTLFTFVFVLSAIALTRGLAKRRLSDFIVSGILLGLATLVRPVTQYFPVVAAAIIIPYRAMRWKLRLVSVVALSLAFLATLTPWLYRNYEEYGHFSLTTIQGENLLLYGASYAKSAGTGRHVDDVREEFMERAGELGAAEGRNPFDNSRIYRDIAVSYIRAHPVLYAKRCLRGTMNIFFNLSTTQICTYLRLPSGNLPYRFFASPGVGETVHGFIESKSTADIVVGIVVGAILLATYLTALVGLGVAARRRQYVLLAFTILVVAYFSVTAGPIGKARYKLPLVPFYSAMSGLGLLSMVRSVRHRRL